MSFGNGYKPRESQKLAPGEYEAGILGARFEQTKNGTPYLAVYVQVKGHPNCRPNCITFYDRPYTGQKEMERWDEKMTEFFDAFGLPRQMTENFAAWHGKKGWIRCVPQKNNPEYSNIYPLIKKAEPQAPQEQQGGTTDFGAPDTGGYAPDDSGFPEDIPF